MSINKHERFGLSAMLIALIAIVSVAFMAMPVSADTTLTIDGSVAPVFGLTCVPTEMHMANMAIGDNELTTGTPTVTITGNTPSWEVKIRDAAPTNVVYGSDIYGGQGAGRMKYVSAGGSFTGAVLGTPMKAKLAGGSYITLDASDTVIMSSAIAGSGPAYTGTFSFKQTILGTDVPHTDGKYQLVTIVSGGATA